MSKLLKIFLAALALGAVSCSTYESDALRHGEAILGADAESPMEHNPKSFSAIVTVKKSARDTVYFQLNDSTTLYPQNYQASYTRMERLFCQLQGYSDPIGSFDHFCMVLWAEPLDQGTVTPGEEPRWSSVTDALDIYDDWMTSVEDGYLTVHYNTFWGRSGVQHSFRLLMSTDPANPYSLVLLQDSHGDSREDEADGLVCFDINALPDTGGEYIPLSLKWKSLEGEVLEREFKFKTRE